MAGRLRPGSAGHATGTPDSGLIDFCRDGATEFEALQACGHTRRCGPAEANHGFATAARDDQWTWTIFQTPETR